MLVTEVYEVDNVDRLESKRGVEVFLLSIYGLRSSFT
jgi:hypothetical protein